MKPTFCLAMVAVLATGICADPSRGAEGQMTAAVHQQRLDGLLSIMQHTISGGPYTSAASSLDSYPLPDWYVDGKLGIFIHYGIFSVPAYQGVGCWYGHNMYDLNSDAYKHQIATYGPLSKFGYKDFIPYLTASEFNPNAWVKLFKDAGARFMAPVSDFHDGFAMWKSSLTDWNAYNMGPKRDYVGQLAVAARRYGLKFGVAWHGFFHNSFFANGTKIDSDVRPPYCGSPWSVYGPAKSDGDLSRAFIDDSMGRLVELVDNYHPDLVWFDFDSQWVPAEDMRQFLAFYYNRSVQWKKGVVVNDKHEGFLPHSVVIDFERGKAAGLRKDVFQTDTSVSWRDWSYIDNDSFKTTDYLVRELVDIVSKNGVLLLDIGPRADGSIPPEPQNLLLGLGAWLKINGDAIYGTRPCWDLGFGEGPHNSGGGGFTDATTEYSSEDFRFTQKGNAIYAIALDWPWVGKGFLIKSLSTQKMISTGGITDVRLLGDPHPLQWKTTDSGLEIQKPSVRPCNGAYAFKITLAGACLEKLSADRLKSGMLKVGLQIRNMDSKSIDSHLTILDNGRPARTLAIKVGPMGVTQSAETIQASAQPGGDLITAALENEPPFPQHIQIIGQPTIGRARKLDGTSILGVTGLGKLDALSISLWAKTSGLTEPWTALMNTNAWVPGALHLQYLQGGQVQVSMMSASGQPTDVHSDAAPGSGSNWHLITVTYSEAAGELCIYIDGTLDSRHVIPSPGPIDLDDFGLGGWKGNGRRFHGDIADVRIFNRALLPAEVHELVTGKPITNGLLAAWDFAGQDAGVAPDTSGHGHDATPAG